MTKVAIIVPPYPLEECPAPPLGLTYVAAAFEQAGADVQILDYLVSAYKPEKLRKALDAFQPDIVGTTSVTLNFYGAADILREAKRHRPDVITIMGGPHVSFAVEETLAYCPEIDLIVRGEGEETIAEIVRRLDEKAHGWPRIQGVAFRRNGEIVNTGWRPFVSDIDALPLPARHLLPLSRYQALGYPISIVTSRGCPYACIFCLGRKMVGNRVRQRNARLVVDEIEQILAYGITRINVADDLFASQKDKVREVCAEIRRRGLHFIWSAFARVNTVDRQTLEWMRDAGCDSVSFGIESGNQDMLRRIRKGITLEMARRAVALCNEVGLLCHTSFMVGLPGETQETLRETKAFAESLGSLFGYHYLAPFPGTTVREDIRRYDLEILTNDWRRYDANSAIVRTSGLRPEDIHAFVAEYDREVDILWKRMVRGYREGTNAPSEDLQVEGRFRMQFVYRLLAEDLIEQWGAVPSAAENGRCGDPLERLIAQVSRAADADPLLVRKTLSDFVRAGYLKVARDGEALRWFWTRNRFVD